MMEDIYIILGMGIPLSFILLVVLGAILDNLIHIRKHLIKEQAEPTICSGCGALSTEKFNKPCCPDSRYISFEQFRDEWRERNQSRYDLMQLTQRFNERMIDPDKNAEELLQELGKAGIFYDEDEFYWFYKKRAECSDLQPYQCDEVKSCSQCSYHK